MDGGDLPRLLINYAGAIDGKTGLEKKQKRHSTVNNQSRKGLSDISNTMGSNGNGNGRPSQTDGEKENIKLIPSPRFKDHVAQLVTENNALLKAVAERNEMIRLTNVELQKRSIQCQKLELQLQKANQQNWELARANSQMLGELNLGKDKLKQLQHELGCARSTIQLKSFEIEEREKSKKKESHQKANTKEGGTDHDEAAKGACHTTIEKKICNTNKRKLKAQSLGTTSLTQSVQSEEKVDGRRRSLRRSVHSTSESHQPVESLHDVKDIEIAVQSITELSHNETVKLEYSSSRGHIGQVKKEEEDLSSLTHFSSEEHGRRSSVGRPLRRAAEKVASYKEMSLKLKIRREE